jgi:hypothetical protein
VYKRCVVEVDGAKAQVLCVDNARNDDISADTSDATRISTRCPLVEVQCLSSRLHLPHPLLFVGVPASTRSIDRVVDLRPLRIRRPWAGPDVPVPAPGPEPRVAMPWRRQES